MKITKALIDRATKKADELIAERKRAGAHPSDGYYKGEQERRIETLLAERDALAARVKTLEEAITTWAVEGGRYPRDTKAYFAAEAALLTIARAALAQKE